MTRTTAERRGASEVITAQDNGPTDQVDQEIVVLPSSATRWDPFIVLGDVRFSTNGFDWHPHRGFQTITLVLEGELEHRDTAGGFGVLGPGDAQYMVAGLYASTTSWPTAGARSGRSNSGSTFHPSSS